MRQKSRSVYVEIYHILNYSWKMLILKARNRIRVSPSARQHRVSVNGNISVFESSDVVVGMSKAESDTTDVAVHSSPCVAPSLE